jgi:predicted nucleic acid-binding protein
MKLCKASSTIALSFFMPVTARAFLMKALLYISLVTRMEILAKPAYEYDKDAEQEAKDFLRELAIIPIDAEIEDLTISIRRRNPHIKLPDDAVRLCRTR